MFVFDDYSFHSRPCYSFLWVSFTFCIMSCVVVAPLNPPLRSLHTNFILIIFSISSLALHFAHGHHMQYITTVSTIPVHLSLSMVNFGIFLLDFCFIRLLRLFRFPRLLWCRVWSWRSFLTGPCYVRGALFIATWSRISYFLFETHLALFMPVIRSLFSLFLPVLRIPFPASCGVHSCHVWSWRSFLARLCYVREALM